MKRSVVLMVLILIIPALALASESDGTIDSAYKNALVCHDVTCTSPTPGVLNFIPTGTTPVTIEDSDGVDGIAWGNEIGWINFDPTGAVEVLVNPSTGALTGKAWAQASGWVNFNPTGEGVFINDDGEFEGYAWTGGPNGGWILFDCGTAGACVKTDWRPLDAREPGGGGGGGYRDVCNNIAGNQTDVPEGLTRSGLSCVSVIDQCPNLAGSQAVVPTPFFKDEGGLCLLRNVDYCSNMEGNQTSVPLGYTVTSDGSCIESDEVPPLPDVIEKDYCPNLFDIQPSLPVGYVIDEGGMCVPQETDYCQNIEGMQTAIPQGQKVDDEGNCVAIPVEELPLVLPESDSGRDVIAYTFVPRTIQIPLDLPFIARFFTEDGESLPLVDLLSVVLTVVAAGVVAWFLPILFGMILKKKWGTVYNALSKEPLVGANVILLNADGTFAKNVVTDDKGKFGFDAKQGMYRISVEAPNFRFPSELLHGAVHDSVGKNQMSNLYFGEPFEIKPFSSVTINIPVDPLSQV